MVEYDSDHLGCILGGRSLRDVPTNNLPPDDRYFLRSELLACALLLRLQLTKATESEDGDFADWEVVPREGPIKVRLDTDSPYDSSDFPRP